MIPQYCRTVLALLNDAGFESYIVGGAVRDLVMGKIPHDYDITTSALPEETVNVMKSNGINVIPTGIKHGTVTAVIDKKPVEITTFRVDGDYKDSRHPETVTFTRSIDGDVARRDFTINAMYLDKNGVVTDKTGGLEDIRTKTVRAVGNPEDRFEEDALRILRCLRFAAQLGFTIEPDTLKAMEKAAPRLVNISGERIAAELDSLVTSPCASDVIRRTVDILSFVIPELKTCQGFNQKSSYHDRDVLEHTLSVLDNIPKEESGKRDLCLALAALFHDIGKPLCFYEDSSGTGHMKGHPEISAKICDRVLTDLHYPNSVREETVKLVRYHDYYVMPARISVHWMMVNCGHDFSRKLAVLQKADILAHSSSGIKRLAQLTKITEVAKEIEYSGAVFRVSDLKISGKDILDLGMDPGPKVGKILESVFEDYVNGLVPNEREELIELTKKKLPRLN